jgi:hypothetical protein
MSFAALMSIKSILAVVAVISALSITLLITTTNFKVISAQDTSSSSNNTMTTTASIDVLVLFMHSNSLLETTYFADSVIFSQCFAIICTNSHYRFIFLDYILKRDRRLFC